MAAILDAGKLFMSFSQLNSPSQSFLTNWQMIITFRHSEQVRLARAKENILKYYALVGVLEQYETFLESLERGNCAMLK